MTLQQVQIAVVIAIVLAPFISYNRFVRQRNAIGASWSRIDAELRRRHDLIPALVETVKGYAAHEEGVLEAVTRARDAAVHEAGGPAEHARAENELARSLRSLFAVAENYPELKASRPFLDLQRELATTEDRIQTARRFYNANVRAYNTRVHAVPSVVIARLFGFTEQRFLDIEAVVREAVPTTGLRAG